MHFILERIKSGLNSLMVPIDRMERDQVPVEHRPSASQIKNFRPQKQEKQQKSAADCVAPLREFCEKPPPQVTIHEQGLLCSAEAVRIMFSFDLALEWL